MANQCSTRSPGGLVVQHAQQRIESTLQQFIDKVILIKWDDRAYIGPQLIVQGYIYVHQRPRHFQLIGAISSRIGDQGVLVELRCLPDLESRAYMQGVFRSLSSLTIKNELHFKICGL